MKIARLFVIVFILKFTVMFSQDITPLQQLNLIEMNIFNGQYDLAEKKILNLLESVPDNKTLNLYCALSRLGISKIPEAVENFQIAFDIKEKLNLETDSILIYVGNGKFVNISNYSQKIVYFRNEGFSFDFKIPYTNICISEDEQSMVYIDATASLNKIFYLKKENNVWSAPVYISEKIGSDGSFFPSCISDDGKRIYFTRYDEFESNIYVSQFDGKNWTALKSLNKLINSKHSETRAFENEDGSVLYFASNRPGGFGGMDLYFSLKIGNDWSKPVNCGARINTNFNEDYPLVCNEGKKLLFCSQGIKKGIDGYEMYLCTIQSDNIYTEPKNIGFPFNSSEDDFTYVPLTPVTRRFFQFVNSSVKPSESNLSKNSSYKANIYGPGETITITDMSGNTMSKTFTETNNSFNFLINEGIYKFTLIDKNNNEINRYLIIPVVLANDDLKINLKF